MKTRLYVFMGLGCEYVLSPLVDFLRSRQCECIGIDLMSIAFSLSDWKRLAKREIIFITSSHLERGNERIQLLSKSAASRYISDILPPLELLDILKPIKSIYIPHDLTTPLGCYEWKFIDQFDLFFNPISFFSVYSGLTEIKEMGWIKYAPSIKTLPSDFVPRKKIIFVSIFEHLQDFYGLKGLFQYFEPLLDEDTAIKFPLWDNHKEVEAYFKKNSVAQVCEAHWNSIEIIKCFDIVISNHVSSTLMEAVFLNKKVVCLESDIATPHPHYQRSFLGHLPNLEFFPYFVPKTISSINSYLESKVLKRLTPEEMLKPFDFSQAYELITA
ncbi:hypothetical protein [Rickettsiella endosymbiont of Litargus connexus]|jgi:hypothetical protein|uniref:hypothetical protein n=1 Tax=Rickettsiella endosymbiont of Litargus connexus TaxID=3066237 RepID=UPI0027F625F8|nr:hypothetical protein [Candidatus Rickettsiella isopodorum]MDQ5899790.1 hypothetical protein [Pseudomonadota bacterium]